jgi:5'-nucleotidase
MRWPLICFDLDNTLYDHERAFHEAMIDCYYYFFYKYELRNNELTVYKWFEQFKINCDRYWEPYEKKTLTALEYRRLRYKKTVDSFQIPYCEEEADAFHTRYETMVSNYAAPFPGVHALFESLSEKGISVGIITNGSSQIQRQKLKKLGLLDLLPDNKLIISEECGIEKPNPAIFQLALETITEKPPLYVGDSWRLDVEAAIQAGWEAIFLNTRKEHIPSNDKPYAICENFRQVLTIIQS